MILDAPNPIIKEILKEEEVTQSELAYHLRRSYPYVNQIVNGLRTPSKEVQLQFAKCLNKSIEELGWEDV